MKNLLFILFLSMSISFTYAQKRVTITKQDGTVIQGYGKIVASGVKYKSTKKSKFKTIKGTEIDKVVLKSKHGTDQYVFRPLKEGKKPKLMALKYEGKSIELYELYLGSPTGVASSGGVSGSVSVNVIRYYVMRKGEKAVTMIRSGAVMGKTFEKRAKAYFTGCPSLLSKLGSKGFKKNDLDNVMKFYDENCGE